MVLSASDSPVDSGRIGTSIRLMSSPSCGGCSLVPGSLLPGWSTAVIAAECEVKGAMVVKKCVVKAPMRMRIASRRESERMSGGMGPGEGTRKKFSGTREMTVSVSKYTSRLHNSVRTARKT